MLRIRACVVAGVALGLLAPPVSAQETPIAFVGARVIPVAGPEIPRGVVVVHRGRIVAVGAEGSVPVPSDARRRDVSGNVLMPGFVDAHSHIGGVQGADASAPIQPEVRALDAINVADSALQKAQAGGITTVNVMPGSGHLLSGQTAYLKRRDRRTIDALLLTTERGVTGGMKMAGDPFSVYTNVLETWVEGEKVFDRSEAKDRLYATGGFGASHDSQGHLHVHDEDMEETR